MKESILHSMIVIFLCITTLTSTILGGIYYKKYKAEKRLASAYVELINSIYENNNDLFLDVIMESPYWDKLQEAYDKNLEVPDTTQWDWETMREL